MVLKPPPPIAPQSAQGPDGSSRSFAHKRRGCCSSWRWRNDLQDVTLPRGPSPKPFAGSKRSYAQWPRQRLKECGGARASRLLHDSNPPTCHPASGERCAAPHLSFPCQQCPSCHSLHLSSRRGSFLASTAPRRLPVPPYVMRPSLGDRRASRAGLAGCWAPPRWRRKAMRRWRGLPCQSPGAPATGLDGRRSAEGRPHLRQVTFPQAAALSRGGGTAIPPFAWETAPCRFGSLRATVLDACEAAARAFRGRPPAAGNLGQPYTVGRFAAK